MRAWALAAVGVLWLTPDSVLIKLAEREVAQDLRLSGSSSGDGAQQGELAAGQVQIRPVVPLAADVQRIADDGDRDVGRRGHGRRRGEVARRGRNDVRRGALDEIFDRG